MMMRELIIGEMKMLYEDLENKTKIMKNVKKKEKILKDLKENHVKIEENVEMM